MKYLRFFLAVVWSTILFDKGLSLSRYGANPQGANLSPGEHLQGQPLNPKGSEQNLQEFDKGGSESVRNVPDFRKTSTTATQEIGHGEPLNPIGFKQGTQQFDRDQSRSGIHSVSCSICSCHG